jgi:hypothetical protein
MHGRAKALPFKHSEKTTEANAAKAKELEDEGRSHPSFFLANSYLSGHATFL